MRTCSQTSCSHTHHTGFYCIFHAITFGISRSKQSTIGWKDWHPSHYWRTQFIETSNSTILWVNQKRHWNIFHYPIIHAKRGDATIGAGMGGRLTWMESVVTPPKIWPCFNELKILLGIKTLNFWAPFLFLNHFLPCYDEFFPKRKLFKYVIGLV